VSTFTKNFRVVVIEWLTHGYQGLFILAFLLRISVAPLRA